MPGGGRRVPWREKGASREKAVSTPPGIYWRIKEKMELVHLV